MLALSDVGEVRVSWRPVKLHALLLLLLLLLVERRAISCNGGRRCEPYARSTPANVGCCRWTAAALGFKVAATAKRSIVVRVMMMMMKYTRQSTGGVDDGREEWSAGEHGNVCLADRQWRYLVAIWRRQRGGSALLFFVEIKILG